MRCLRGGIPRAFLNHKSPEGDLYGDYCRSLLDRVGAVPKSARPTLKAAGLLVVELDRLSTDLDVARHGRRRRDQNRIRRQMVIMRSQLVTLERRLEELSSRKTGRGGPSLADVMGEPRG